VDLMNDEKNIEQKSFKKGHPLYPLGAVVVIDHDISPPKKTEYTLEQWDALQK
jgi:hypothetical protein